MLRHRRLRKLVDGNRAFLVHLHAGGFQTHAFDIRLAADGEHHAIAFDHRAVRQLGVITLRALFDGVDRLAGDNLDAALLQLGAQMLAHIIVEAAQDILAAVKQCHFRAEPGKNAGELHSNVAAALDHDTFRQFGKVEGFVRRNDEIASGNFRPERRPAARRDQDVVGADFLAVREPNGVRVFQHRALAHELGFRAFQCRDVSALEARDLRIFVVNERRPAEDRLRHGPAVTRRIDKIVGIARGVNQQLLWHAAADHAGAADAVFLRDHHPRAMLAGNARGTHAAGARTNNKKIDVVVGHALLPLDHAHAIRPGQHCNLRQANEQAVLDDAGDG